ncbi:long-chain fatty acid transport protein 6-like [Octopus vulgaris]|uniref:Long-chain-fatty-acid--CoA ligase n=1 Tax=Octopus vulgaris TaxID=6645 RepID=A0AA36AJJ4_OCTVU|nr:long-chain fatty acid transport protein 6-like [Octopus vulgaris]
MMDPKSLLLAAATGCASAVGYYSWQKAVKPFAKNTYFDLKQIAMGMKIFKKSQEILVSKDNFISVFDKTLSLYPNKTMLIFEGKHYTYDYVNKMASRVGNYMLSCGMKQGDVVAIYLTNSPQFIWTILGLIRVGLIPSLLNFNVQGQGLVHCIKVCEPVCIIADSDPNMQRNLQHVYPELNNIPVYIIQTYDIFYPPLEISWTDFDDILAKSSDAQIDPAIANSIGSLKCAMYIYTSGTTGLPKPCILTHVKCRMICVLAGLLQITHHDIVYNTLPFYHTSGLLLGMFLNIYAGTTTVVKRKFSASTFWDDIEKYNATVVLYIGELCRFVLAQHNKNKKISHKVRLMYGNGLGIDIWETFQKTFRIPNIYELYGATEGNCFLINFHNRCGAVGRLSPLLNRLNPAKMFLVKYDLDACQPLRNSEGRCIPVEIGEAGLLLGKVVPEHDIPLYKGKKEMSDAKFVFNVMEEGDKYFNTGDLLYSDNDYFLYFKDRIGDTFRWKGENISTLDVANVIRSLDFIEDANVYGVKVPGHGGRAGMASLKLYDGINMTNERFRKIYDYCKRNLISHAVPLFLRIQDNMELSGTFKQQKKKLQEEGFDPSVVTDSLYYIDHSMQTYLPLTENMFKNINFKKSKL